MKPYVNVRHFLSFISTIVLHVRISPHSSKCNAVLLYASMSTLLYVGFKYRFQFHLHFTHNAFFSTINSFICEKFTSSQY